MDRTRSRELGRLARARNRECYTNAARALGAERESAYVEGYVVSHDLLLVFEHGWIERPDGTIIDPTPAYWGSTRNTHTYFPAFRWSWDDIWALFGASGDGELTFPLHAKLPMRGSRCPEWRDAVVNAHRHRAALCLAATGELPHDPAEERDLLRALVGRYWIDGPRGLL